MTWTCSGDGSLGGLLAALGRRLLGGRRGGLVGHRARLLVLSLGDVGGGSALLRHSLDGDGPRAVREILRLAPVLDGVLVFGVPCLFARLVQILLGGGVLVRGVALRRGQLGS